MPSITEFIHLLLATVVLVVSCTAALQALLLAAQERMLRRKQLNSVMRQFPPLAVVESLLFRLIAIGFVLLTLVLLSGMSLFLPLLTTPHLWQKTLLSTVAWLVFMLLLLGRWSRGWRGRIAIGWTLLGVSLIIVIYLGTISFIVYTPCALAFAHLPQLG